MTSASTVPWSRACNYKALKEGPWARDGTRHGEWMLKQNLIVSACKKSKAKIVVTSSCFQNIFGIAKDGFFPSLDRSNQESQGVDLGYLDRNLRITWDPQWSKTLRIFSVTNPPPKSLPEKGFCAFVTKHHAKLLVIHKKNRNSKEQTPLSIWHKQYCQTFATTK